MALGAAPGLEVQRKLRRDAAHREARADREDREGPPHEDLAALVEAEVAEIDAALFVRVHGFGGRIVASQRSSVPNRSTARFSAP